MRFSGQQSELEQVRLIPHFLIIGVQKGGTTSLYEYLQQHPQIQPALTKEVHFFDLNFEKGWEWYRQQLGVNNPEFDADTLVTGEASPYYIFHPLVPARIFERVPNIKLIILLRDPVARSLSQYHHECRWDFESLSLEDALHHEPTRLAPEPDKFARDTHYQSYAYQHYSYQERGRYLEQIQRWQQYFSPDQILVIQSEFFDQNPSLTLQKTLSFLGLDEFKFTTQQRYNSGQYPDASEAIKQKLAMDFVDSNRQLLAHLERYWPAENLVGFGPGEVNWLTPISQH
ncbi:MAG: sulfotransferase domain-containing protein [Cyanobacteria bacterium P01_H01_bin.130]